MLRLKRNVNFHSKMLLQLIECFSFERNLIYIRRMLGHQKGLSTAFVSLAIVTLLSYCSPASSFAFLPRVSRTKDAVVIDCMSN
jgi:hypothetical protein